LAFNDPNLLDFKETTETAKVFFNAPSLGFVQWPPAKVHNFNRAAPPGTCERRMVCIANEQPQFAVNFWKRPASIGLDFEILHSWVTLVFVLCCRHILPLIFGGVAGAFFLDLS
jgi:hypothetical protein